MICTKNFIRETASSEPTSPFALQSAFFAACAARDTAPAAALFRSTASVMSTLPSRLVSPYRTVELGTSEVFFVVVALVVAFVAAVVTVVAGAVVLEGDAKQNADCDGSNEIDSNDAVVLLRFLVHIINSLPSAE